MTIEYVLQNILIAQQYFDRFDSSKGNLEEPVICPKCGDIAIASFCGWLD